MKTKLLLYTAIICFMTIGLGGCTKESQVEQSSGSQPQIQNEDVSLLIKSFMNRLSSKLKSTDSIPSDSADWYLGATVNYQYGDGTAKGPTRTLNTFHVTLLTNGTYVPMDNVRDIYQDIVDSLRGYVYLVDTTNRHLLAAMISTTRIQSTQLTIEVTAITTSGNFPSSGFWEFGENDYWKWWNGGGNWGGYCDGMYNGSATSTDAAEQIEQRVRFRKPIPLEHFCYGPPYISFTIIAQDYPNPDWVYPDPENYYRYRLFYNHSQFPVFHTCLSPEEMNFYLLGAEHIVYVADNDIDPGARPPDHSFIDLDLWGDAMYPVGYSIIWHRGLVNYGMLIQTGGLPDNL